ncbi:MAG: hypothetical protein ABII06_03755 [Pseudomonadota bacterium]
MDARGLVDPDRIRKITGSFSWIDHRFISGGFIRDLSREEILIYLFLVAVSDRQGLSFYHDDRICSLLKIDLASLGEARENLSERALIAWRSPVYQVLALPPQPVSPLSPEERLLRQRQRSLAYIRKIQEVIA